MKLPFRITPVEFFSILRQVVIDYPGADLCTQVNTFATYHQPSDYNATNFNKKYPDYESGFFWSRDWVYAGADPGELKKQYPLLHVEHTRSQIADFDRGNWSHEYWLVISDVYDCEDCNPACRRTRDQVQLDVQTIYMNILAEVWKYAKWKVVKDADEWLLWATEDKVKAMQAATTIDSYEHTNLELRLFANFDGQGGQWGRGVTTQNLTGWGGRVSLNHCTPEPLAFNYTEQSIKEIGTANCLTCR